MYVYIHVHVCTATMFTVVQVRLDLVVCDEAQLYITTNWT